MEKSFIDNPTVQHKFGRQREKRVWLLWLGVACFTTFGTAVGYLLGKTTLPTSDPVLQALQLPVTIVAASVSKDSNDVLVADVTPTISAEQLAQTVGKLHADILTLRMLYRRLAEDAGLDLTDFELNDVIVPPTKLNSTDATSTDAALGKINDQLGAIEESSAALEQWYNLRFQERAFALEGPVVMTGRMSSRFGWRQSPSTGETRLHKGVDFSGQRGEPILALADGVVTFSGTVHAYGNMVEILHADGLATRYAHNESNTVKLGQRVEQGQIIARLGSTGRSTGPHVHLEVHLKGEAVDPMLFIE